MAIDNMALLQFVNLAIFKSAIWQFVSWQFGNLASWQVIFSIISEKLFHKLSSVKYIILQAVILSNLSNN